MNISQASSNSILPVEGIKSPAGAQRTNDFSSILKSAIQRVESTGNNAAAAVDQFLSGEGGELHETVLATQRAALEFDMFMQVRNKVVSAYQEVMRMQL